jgi:hypothetical protein
MGLRLPLMVLAIVLLPPVAYAPGSPAETPEQVAEPVKGVVLKLRLDRTTVPLSGRLRLTLTAAGPAMLEIDPITSIVIGNDWEAHPGKAESAAKGQRLEWSQTFELEPLAFDKDKKVPLTVTPLRYRITAAGDWREQAWNPMDITVTSSVPSANLDDACGITGIETLPPLPSWTAWKIGGAAGLVALAGIAVGAWRWRRRPPPAVLELPPHEWALCELERIDALDLPGGQEVERYHTLLSDVLRRYLEMRFGLHAPEQTTPEFLAGLQKSAVLPAAQQEHLRHFLERCDLAKFARAEFTVSECRAVAGLAREFIGVTAKKADNPMSACNGQPAASA